MTLASDVSSARKRIFRDGYDISFGELVSLYEKRELIIQPEYQRLFRWEPTQKTRFIESLLLNIPIPPVFVFSDQKGRWELVDGLQRVSTVLEFMGLLIDEEGKKKPPFTCDGTSLLPSLQKARWPITEEEENDETNSNPEILPVNLQLGIRRARIRVEILGQETDSHVKYELFQRLNSGGSNLSEQELRNCVLISINRTIFDHIKNLAANKDFLVLAKVGSERINRQYLLELAVRFVVLRNYKYKNGLDVHEYLDKGIIYIAEDNDFDWEKEKRSFSITMSTLIKLVGEEAFFKSNRFSLAMYEFITLGLSKAIEGNVDLDPILVKDRIGAVPRLPEAEKYSGSGVRGTQRLASFVVPLAEAFFVQQAK